MFMEYDKCLWNMINAYDLKNNFMTVSIMWMKYNLINSPTDEVFTSPQTVFDLNIFVHIFLYYLN